MQIVITVITLHWTIAATTGGDILKYRPVAYSLVKPIEIWVLLRFSDWCHHHQFLVHRIRFCRSYSRLYDAPEA